MDRIKHMSTKSQIGLFLIVVLNTVIFDIINFLIFQNSSIFTRDMNVIMENLPTSHYMYIPQMPDSIFVPIVIFSLISIAIAVGLGKLGVRKKVFKNGIINTLVFILSIKALVISAILYLGWHLIIVPMALDTFSEQGKILITLWQISLGFAVLSYIPISIVIFKRKKPMGA